MLNESYRVTLMKKQRQPRLPKDLGIKIGTKEEALWTPVVKGLKTEIESAERSLKVSRKFLELAEKELEKSK